MKTGWMLTTLWDKKQWNVCDACLPCIDGSWIGQILQQTTLYKYTLRPCCIPHPWEDNLLQTPGCPNGCLPVCYWISNCSWFFAARSTLFDALCIMSLQLLELWKILKHGIFSWLAQSSCNWVQLNLRGKKGGAIMWDQKHLHSTHNDAIKRRKQNQDKILPFNSNWSVEGCEKAIFLGAMPLQLPSSNHTF